MDINIRGARKHNLKNVDIEFKDGITIVTGVSGSGKTSLVFDTLYHEARRRFLDAFSKGQRVERLNAANVESLTGVGPAIAVGQNLLNRNPLSTLATASGLHPFLRVLFARFGTRHCVTCRTPLHVLTLDEIIERLVDISANESLTVFTPLVQSAKGSHQTLLALLKAQFGQDLLVDGQEWTGYPLDPANPHTIWIELARFQEKTSAASTQPTSS